MTSVQRATRAARPHGSLSRREPGQPWAAALSPAYYLSVLLSLLSRPEWYPDMRCSSWDRKVGRINREKAILVPEKQSRKSKLGVC